jgi:hypothetical protein
MENKVGIAKKIPSLRVSIVIRFAGGSANLSTPYFWRTSNRSENATTGDTF